MTRVVAALAIGAATLLVYAGTTSYGLFADDFNWLAGARSFDIASLVHVGGRAHFYRPVIELYFPAVLSVCGSAPSCYHWFSVALHFVASLAVGALAASLSRSTRLGVLAGLVFAMQPAGVEAVVWVSAVSELLATLLFVLTVWLFWRALDSGRRRDFVYAACTFIACLLTHESGVMLLPILGLLTVSVPISPQGESGLQRLRAHRAVFVSLAIVLAAYGAMTYAISVRNYVVVEGQYALGMHMIDNVARALGTFVVARRDALGSVIVVLFFVWACTLAGPRARFYALWTIAALLPFAGFRGGLSSRYLYLAAAGCAGLIAETLWWVRERFASTVPAAALWAIVTVGVLVRFGTFAAKNVQAWAAASAPYRTYFAQIHAAYPSPERGALLVLPAPPHGVESQNIPAFVRWEYGDNTLNVVVR